MRTETVRPLDTETLDLFASKGKEGGPGIPQAGIANGVKVRRVVQILRDLAKRPMEDLRVLDLACGEGMYAIETALRGAKVLALDARTERMDKGCQAAERLGLTNLEFKQNDVRQVTTASYGRFDVIYFLGILYHLDIPEVFYVLENIYDICRELVIIDTHVCLLPQSDVRYKGGLYKGAKTREHGDNDPDPVRRSKLLKSLDNTFSFQFTKDSLIRLLNDTGFTSVFECHVPLEPFKPSNRITVAATKGTRVTISAYPWVNDKSEEDIEATLRSLEQAGTPKRPESLSGTKRYFQSAVNGILRPLGYEIRRV
jgi:SAM-dependent methyltransferase